jgi:MFS family permease
MRTPSTTPRRGLVLAICCLSLFLVTVDNTITNVALPAIQRDLDAPVSGLQWIVAAYTLVLAALLILAGSGAAEYSRPDWWSSRPVRCCAVSPRR